MLLSIVKVVPLAFLFTVWVPPVMASSKSKLEAFEFDVKARAASLTPQDVRQKVLEANHEKEYFGLFRGVSYERKGMLRIQALHNFGEATVSTKGEFKNFVAKISNKPNANEASAPNAALDFLTQSLSSLPPQEAKGKAGAKDEGKDKNALIRKKVLSDMEKLLVFDYVQNKEKAKFRPATTAERTFVWRGIFETAVAGFSNTPSDSHDFTYWNLYLKGRYAGFNGNKDVQETVKTSAVASALTTVAFRVVNPTLGIASMGDGSAGIMPMIFAGVQEIFTQSRMKEVMFYSLLKEFNEATGNQLANVLKAWESRKTLPSPSVSSPASGGKLGKLLRSLMAGKKGKSSSPSPAPAKSAHLAKSPSPARSNVISGSKDSDDEE